MQIREKINSHRLHQMRMCCQCWIAGARTVFMYAICMESGWLMLWAFKRLAGYLSLVSAILLLRAQATALANFLIPCPRLTCILLKFIGYAFCILTDVFLSKLSLLGSERVSLVITVWCVVQRIWCLGLSRYSLRIWTKFTTNSFFLLTHTFFPQRGFLCVLRFFLWVWHYWCHTLNKSRLLSNHFVSVIMSSLVVIMSHWLLLSRHSTVVCRLFSAALAAISIAMITQSLRANCECMWWGLHACAWH